MRKRTLYIMYASTTDDKLSSETNYELDLVSDPLLCKGCKVHRGYLAAAIRSVAWCFGSNGLTNRFKDWRALFLGKQYTITIMVQYTDLNLERYTYTYIHTHIHTYMPIYSCEGCDRMCADQGYSQGAAIASIAIMILQNYVAMIGMPNIFSPEKCKVLLVSGPHVGNKAFYDEMKRRGWADVIRRESHFLDPVVHSPLFRFRYPLPSIYNRVLTRVAPSPRACFSEDVFGCEQDFSRHNNINNLIYQAIVSKPVKPYMIDTVNLYICVRMCHLCSICVRFTGTVKQLVAYLSYERGNTRNRSRIDDSSWKPSRTKQKRKAIHNRFGDHKSRCIAAFRGRTVTV